MNVCVLGHSYVNDLKNLGPNPCYSKDGIPLFFHYISVKGSTFASWLDSPPEWSRLRSLQPNFIVVMLGSTSITNRVTDEDLRQDSKRFYKLIRHEFPDSILIAVQAELRFVPYPNEQFIPPSKIYAKRRRKFNNYLRKVMKIVPGRNHICMIAGPGRLDNLTLYRDNKTHLNSNGTQNLLIQILSTINFILLKQQHQLY